jgi:hypothetical protein
MKWHFVCLRSLNLEYHGYFTFTAEHHISTEFVPYVQYIKENILELGTGQEMASKEGSLLFISLDFQCGGGVGGGSGLIFLCTVQTSVPETEMEFLNVILCPDSSFCLFFYPHFTILLNAIHEWTRDSYGLLFYGFFCMYFQNQRRVYFL